MAYNNGAALTADEITRGQSIIAGMKTPQEIAAAAAAAGLTSSQLAQLAGAGVSAADIEAKTKVVAPEYSYSGGGGAIAEAAAPFTATAAQKAQYDVLSGEAKNQAIFDTQAAFAKANDNSGWMNVAKQFGVTTGDVNNATAWARAREEAGRAPPVVTTTPTTPTTPTMPTTPTTPTTPATPVDPFAAQRAAYEKALADQRKAYDDALAKMRGGTGAVGTVTTGAPVGQIGAIGGAVGATPNGDQVTGGGVGMDTNAPPVNTTPSALGPNSTSVFDAAKAAQDKQLADWKAKQASSFAAAKAKLTAPQSSITNQISKASPAAQAKAAQALKVIGQGGA